MRKSLIRGSNKKERRRLVLWMQYSASPAQCGNTGAPAAKTTYKFASLLCNTDSSNRTVPRDVGCRQCSRSCVDIQDFKVTALIPTQQGQNDLRFLAGTKKCGWSAETPKGGTVSLQGAQPVLGWDFVAPPPLNRKGPHKQIRARKAPSCSET